MIHEITQHGERDALVSKGLGIGVTERVRVDGGPVEGDRIPVRVERPGVEAWDRTDP